ncbi:MAG: hypothetical protein ACRD2L_07665 [Terriglobia bacterium]
MKIESNAIATMLRSVRNIKPPLTEEHLQPLEPPCRAVAIVKPLSDSEHRQVAELLRRHPATALQIIWHLNHCVPHLHFLRYYKGLASLTIDVWNIESTEGIEELAESVERLFLGPTHPPPLRQGALAPFKKVRILQLNAAPQSIQEAANLPELRVLSLRSISKLEVGLLRPASKLRTLHVGLGSMINADELAKLTKLQRLNLWRVRGIENAGFLADMVSLRDVHLQDFPKIERLPSLVRLNTLHRFVIQGMKSLVDISGAAESPSLKELLVFNSLQLTPENFKPFVNHPSLTHASVAIGSDKKNVAIEQLLSLPRPDRFGKGIFDDPALLQD